MAKTMRYLAYIIMLWEKTVRGYLILISLSFLIKNRLLS